MDSNATNPIRFVVRRFALLSSIEILNKTLGFLATAHLARVLRPENFGIIGFTVAVLAYFDLFVDGGLGFYGTREVSRDPRAASRLVSNILAARLVLAVIAFLVLVAISRAVSDSESGRLTLIFYGLTLFTFAVYPDWLCFGLQKTPQLGIASLTVQFCFAVGVYVLVASPSQVVRVPLIQTISEGASVVILFYLLRIPFRPRISNSDRSVWKQLWRRAGPIGMGNAMRTVNYSFDIILVGLWLDPQMTGSYVAAFRVTLLLITFGGLYGQIFLPAVTRALKNGAESCARVLEQSVGAGAVAIFPAAAGGGLLAAGVFETVFGEGYAVGVAPFRILLFGVVVIVLNTTFRQTLIAANQEMSYFKLSAVSAAVNVGLNLILIPRYQLEGAAVATVVSESLYLVLSLLVVQARIVRLNFVRPLVRPLLATIIMSAVVAPIRHRFGVAIAAGILTYFVLLWMLGVVRVGDLMSLIRGGDKDLPEG